MSGGGGSNSTTVQKADPWKGQQPYLQEIFREAQRLYNAPGPDYFPGATVAPFSRETEAALEAQAARARAGSPLTAAGQNELQRILGGQYLNANPHLDQAIDIASRGLARNYRNAVQPGIDSSFSAAGRYGSGLHQAAQAQAEQALAAQLGDIAAGLAWRDYGAERAAMQRAAALAPQLAAADYADIAQLGAAGRMRDQMNQALINDQIARFNFAQQLPYNKLAQYMGLIQGDYGGTVTTTAPRQGASLLEGALAGGGLGATIGSTFTGIGPWGPLVGLGLGGLLTLFD